MKLEVTTEVEFEEQPGKVVINVKFPNGQQKLSIPDAAHILAGGLSLLVRGATKENCGMTDYELMESVIANLNHHFTDTKDFRDIEVNKNVFK